MGSIIIAVILAVSITIWAYETYYEKQEKKVNRVLAPKIEFLIQESSRKIAIREKELNKELTNSEKDKILDECYQEI